MGQIALLDKQALDCGLLHIQLGYGFVMIIAYVLKNTVFDVSWKQQLVSNQQRFKVGDLILSHRTNSCSRTPFQDPLESLSVPNPGQT